MSRYGETVICMSNKSSDKHILEHLGLCPNVTASEVLSSDTKDPVQ